MVRQVKILIVNKYLYPNGGSETYIINLSKELVMQGHEVEYFGMQNERNILGNTSESYTKNMDFHNTSHMPINPFKILYSLEARKKIRKVLDAFRPDAVLLNNFNYQITPSILYEIVRDKLPVIYTAHDYQLICPNHMLYDLKKGTVCEACRGASYVHCLMKKCVHGSLLKSALGMLEAYLYKSLHTYRYLDRIICPSSFIENKLNLNKDLRGKTIVMHNFIDQPPPKETEKEDYVLYFGRYSKEKGIGKLIRVCRELPEIHFVFAGQGPLKGELDNIPNIKEVGFKTRDELEDIIRKARFTLYPSEWYENCPFSVMESLTYGTPVIGADTGGIPELIDNGGNGYLFDSGNIKDLKDRIIMLWNNKELCNELSRNCRHTGFDSANGYGGKLIRLFEQLITAKACKEPQET